MILNSAKQSAKRVGQFKNFTIHQLQSRLLDLKLKAFEPKIHFAMDFDSYTVKTAETPKELRSVLELRNRVFWQERLGSPAKNTADFDRFDLLADHILLIEKTSGEVIGTYRLISSLFSKEFYTQTEFELDQFLQSPQVKLELSRACIHENFRSGSTISLVWKGLARYIQLSQSEFLFGCSSVDTTHAYIANALVEKLRPEFGSEEFSIRPKIEFQFGKMARPPKLAFVENCDELIPPLLGSYLKAGAKLHGQPALDRVMQTTDFLTILKVSTMNEKYKRRFFL